MIYIQSYHSGVVGPVQVRTSKKIPTRESPERPLVCMPQWLSGSVCQCGDDSTGTQSYSTPYRFSLDSDSDMTSVRVDLYVCMGCQSGQSGHGATYFPTSRYKAAACHYARSCACNQSNRGIRLVTIQSRPSDRDAGGAGASGPWPPACHNPQDSGM